MIQQWTFLHLVYLWKSVFDFHCSMQNVQCETRSDKEWWIKAHPDRMCPNKFCLNGGLPRNHLNFDIVNISVTISYVTCDLTFYAPLSHRIGCMSSVFVSGEMGTIFRNNINNMKMFSTKFCFIKSSMWVISMCFATKLSLFIAYTHVHCWFLLMKAKMSCHQLCWEE